MSILRNINYIKKLNVVQCTQPDVFVLVETGFAAAAPALLNLFVPGCTDIIKMKLGISPWHARGIRSLIKSAAAPFALDATKFLYKIGYFTAERGLYYLMVADIAVEFVATWQSLVFVAEQCQLPDAGTAYGYISAFVYNPGDERIMIPAPIHNVTGMAVGTFGITIFPGFQGTLAWSTTWDSYPTRGQGVNVTTWMTEDDLEDPFSQFTTNVPPSQPRNETIGHVAFDTTRAFTGKRYVLHMRNDGDVEAQPVASSYTVQMHGHPTGVLPWGCKFKKTSIPFA